MAALELLAVGIPILLLLSLIDVQVDAVEGHILGLGLDLPLLRHTPGLRGSHGLGCLYDDGLDVLARVEISIEHGRVVTRYFRGLGSLDDMDIIWVW